MGRGAAAFGLHALVRQLLLEIRSPSRGSDLEASRRQAAAAPASAPRVVIEVLAR